MRQNIHFSQVFIGILPVLWARKREIYKPKSILSSHIIVPKIIFVFRSIEIKLDFIWRRPIIKNKLKNVVHKSNARYKAKVPRKRLRRHNSEAHHQMCVQVWCNLFPDSVWTLQNILDPVFRLIQSKQTGHL